MINDDNGIRRIRYIRTIDGDTFVGDLLVAPQLRPIPKIEVAVRVEGWSAEELNEREGPFMRDAFRGMLEGASVITVRLKTMSFQRIVAAVFLDDILFAGLLHTTLTAYRRTHA